MALTQRKHQSIFLPSFCSKLQVCTKSWHCYPSLVVQCLTNRMFHSLHLDRICCCLKGWTVFNYFDASANSSNAYHLPSLPQTYSVNEAIANWCFHSQGHVLSSLGDKLLLCFRPIKFQFFLLYHGTFNQLDSPHPGAITKVFFPDKANAGGQLGGCDFKKMRHNWAIIQSNLSSYCYRWLKKKNIQQYKTPTQHELCELYI